MEEIHRDNIPVFKNKSHVLLELRGEMTKPPSAQTPKKIHGVLISTLATIAHRS
jgi:hypothetical protein